MLQPMELSIQIASSFIKNLWKRSSLMQLLFLFLFLNKP